MAVNLAKLFIIFILVYYTKYILFFLNSKVRKGLKKKKLNKLRTISVKSLKEQKEFINLKHPKSGGFKFQFKMIPLFLFHTTIYIILYKIYYYLFGFTDYEFKLWQAIIFMMIFPFLINRVLKLFNLNKQDISVFFSNKC